MEEIYIKIQVEDWQGEPLKLGQIFRYKGVVYKFDGYDFGTYPMATNIETGEQEQLPHY